MQKILIVVVVLVVAAGGMWYVLQQQDEAKAPAATQNEETAMETREIEMTTMEEVAPMEGEQSGSLESLFTMKEAVRCDFRSSMEGQSSNGTFYTDGERFRIDVVHTSALGTITSYLVNDGSYLYTWGTTPTGPMAVKTPYQPLEPAAAEGESAKVQEPGAIDVAMQVWYECADWTVDATLLVPPTDIDFMDVEAMMRGSIEAYPPAMVRPEVN